MPTCPATAWCRSGRVCDTVNPYGRYGDTAYGAPAGRAERRWAIEQTIKATNLSTYNRIVTLAILEGESYASAAHWVDAMRGWEVSDGAATED